MHSSNKMKMSTIQKAVVCDLCFSIVLSQRNSRNCQSKMELFMKWFYILAFISLVKSQTQRQIDNNPNDFRMFENFGLTKNVYINETKIVEKVQEIRRNLQHLKSVITNYKNKTETLQKLKHFKMFQTEDFNQINEWFQEFPTVKDWEGAAAGLTKLLITYDVDLPSLNANKTIEYVESSGIQRRFGSFESLSSADFGVLAMQCKERKQYGQAIHFLRESFRLIPFDTEDRRPQGPQLKLLQNMRKDLVKLNNGYLQKRGVFVDENIATLPYYVTDKLNKKKKQPSEIRMQKYLIGKALDHYLEDVCRRGQLQAKHYEPKILNCRFLHHNDAYLKLGPFKEEQMLEIPYTVVFHDILSELEINSLISEAIPNLSRKRYNGNDIAEAVAEHEFKGNSKKVKVVHKTVQSWLHEVDWEDQNRTTFEDAYVGRNYHKMNYPLFWKLGRKIELATQLQTHTHYAASPMQVTNYGLGGLCESHVDPHGYIEGKEVPHGRKYLVHTGDMIGTFMAWLKDTEAGGGTAYVVPGYEGVVMPEKGAAAFWYDLKANGYIDVKSQHYGCPVLKGSKWILNKWMYYFDNFKKFPCQMDPELRFDPPDQSHYF